MRTIRDVETAVATILAQHSIPINVQATIWLGQQTGKHPIIAMGAAILVMQSAIDAMASKAPIHESGLFRDGIRQVITNCLNNLDRTRQMGLSIPQGSA
jgi:hypothetical protein